MTFNYPLTNKVEKFIENATLKEIKIGCSDSQVFEIIKDNKSYYIKIA